MSGGTAGKPDARQRLDRIWATVREIPAGAVASYGQVAELAGIPRGARQVGYALRQLPKGSDVPWHRVVTSSGKLAFDVGSRSYRRQVQELGKEAVPVSSGRVEMKKYRWQPDLDELLWKPSAAWDSR
jgi:methylated-DNA-protein-cysteine methyltransferase related protein